MTQLDMAKNHLSLTIVGEDDSQGFAFVTEYFRGGEATVLMADAPWVPLRRKPSKAAFRRNKHRRSQSQQGNSPHHTPFVSPFQM